jgi:hypothetical protein
MDLPNFDVTLLPGEWFEVDGAAARELESELAAEVSPGHRLHAEEVRAVAARRHLKDVVFWVPGMSQRGLVHLTGRPESDARWPSTSLHHGWGEVVADLMD